MAVITIRGKLGSGAQEIGRLVATRLNTDYLDREIIAEVAARLNLQEQEILAKEMPPVTLQERIAEALARGYSIGDGIQGAYLLMWQIPFDDNRYIEALSSFIHEMGKSNTVIYGRGSQFILKDNPQAIHVSIIAPFKTRLKRVIDERGLTEDRAKQEITRFDNAAREFIRRYFNADMDDPMHYHLVINTDKISYESAAAIVSEAARLKETQAIC